MRALVRFRARSKGGITPQEIDRRETAVLRAIAGDTAVTPLPPSMIAAALEQAEARAVPDDKPGEIAEPVVATIAAPQFGLGPRARRQPFPVATVTISGSPGCGKRTLAHILREALAFRGVVFEGPDGLRSVHVRHAVDGLIDRGWSVRLVYAEDETSAEAAE